MQNRLIWKEDVLRAFWDDAGAHVQCIWSSCTVPQGLGEVQLQGGEVGQEGQQVWRLQYKNMSSDPATGSAPHHVNVYSTGFAGDAARDWR